MNDDQTTTPMADSSAPAPVASPVADMTGQQVVDTAKTVLDNEPAMGMVASSPIPEPPVTTTEESTDDKPEETVEAPAMDSATPAAAPEAPAESMPTSEAPAAAPASAPTDPTSGAF